MRAPCNPAPRSRLRPSRGDDRACNPGYFPDICRFFPLVAKCRHRKHAEPVAGFTERDGKAAARLNTRPTEYRNRKISLTRELKRKTRHLRRVLAGPSTHDVKDPVKGDRLKSE